jgi:predicted enzyme related to lactoylglutathione lyase
MTTPTTTPTTSAAPTHTPAANGGRFVWHDLMTSDATAGLAFYQALFGWTTSSMDMGDMGTYTVVEAHGSGLGGVVPLDPSHGVPSHWIAYVTTADVDATTAHAQSLGATVGVPPTDIPNVGRFSVVADPAGAHFSPFRGDGPDMPASANPPLGTVAWNELMTSDASANVTFYPALFGWTHETMDMGPMGTYHLFRRAGEFVAGMMQLPPEETRGSHWLPYFAVASADTAATRIAELGGTILVAPMDIGDWGRSAMAMDPTGAVFGVLETKKAMVG